MSFRKKDYDPNDPYRAAANEEYYSAHARVKLLPAVIALLLAVISVVIFILTEDMSNSMTLFDRNTVLMAILLIVSIAAFIAGRKKSGGNDNRDSRF